MYLTKTPFWLKALYPSLLWNKSREEKSVYLSFDDGPTPEITHSVLDMLSQYDAQATFFLIGNNVAAHPEIADRIIERGHTVGNHTYHHMNGSKNNTLEYVNEVKKCSELVDSRLFRPPYGRIHSAQIKALKKLGYSIIMWDVLSADFDVKLSGEKCYQNVIRSVKNGSIIVFHDSLKAWPRLKESLPRVLKFLDDQGYSMKAIPSP